MNHEVPNRLANFQWLSRELLDHWTAARDFSVIRAFISDLPRVERRGLIEYLFYDGLKRGDWQLGELCGTEADLIVPNDESNFGPLHHQIICNEDRPDIVDWLIRNGAEIERRGYGNSTPLISAVGHALYGTVLKLLDCGANVNATTEVDDSESSLMVAAAKGDLGMIELLVERGADVSAKNRWGVDVEQIAKAHGHGEVADALHKRSRE